MSAIDGGQAVEVNIGDCLCPGDPRPHPSDIVWMRAKPDLQMGLAAIAALRQSGDYIGDANAAVYSVFVRYGVVAWNITDELGKPVPVTFEAILDRLGWLEGGKIVAQKGMELYQDKVFVPLALPSSVSPQPTHSNGSTSRTRPSSRKPRTSSPRSSPSRRVAST